MLVAEEKSDIVNKKWTEAEGRPSVLGFEENLSVLDAQGEKGCDAWGERRARC